MREKRLYLLRHTQACKACKTHIDFETPLTKNGRKQAQQVGVYLKKHACHPELVFCSKAKRCIDTLSIIKKDMPPAPIVYHHFLYLASGYTVLEMLNLIGDDIDDVLVVGHSQAICQLPVLLLPDVRHIDKRLNSAYPCGTLICLSFPFSSPRWRDVLCHQMKIDDIFYP